MIGVGITLTPSKGGGFDFADWRAQQLDGIWLDYTDPDWLRQEPNGPTAVAATNDVIGLALSRRLAGGQTLAQVLAGATELASNPGPSFPNLTGWTQLNGGVATIVNGEIVITCDGVTNFNGLRLKLTGLVVGRSYRLQATARRGTSPNNVVVRMGSTAAITAVNSSSTSNTTGEIIFTATATTDDIFVIDSGSPSTGTLILNQVSFKEVSRAAATQATLNQRLKFDGLNGAICDALDDNHLSTYTLKSGVNLLLGRFTIPASVPSYQVPLGLQRMSDGRFRLAISNTSGRLEVAVGNDTTLFGDGVDIRGQTINAAVACDGSTVRIFRGEDMILEAPQNGGVDTVIPLRFGCNNANGGVGNFFGGRILKAGAFHMSSMPDVALWRRISASL